MPEVEAEVNQKVLDDFAAARKVIDQVRRIRTEKNIPQKKALTLNVYTNPSAANPATDVVIAKLCNLEHINYLESKDIDGASFIENKIQYSMPLTGLVDMDEEIKKLEADLKYAEGFLQNVLKKLSNERFVNNAPQQVVDIERKKQADAEEKIRIIKEQLAKLK
jgi:valyl-tRNA synthetase